SRRDRGEIRGQSSLGHWRNPAELVKNIEDQSDAIVLDICRLRGSRRQPEPFPVRMQIEHPGTWAGQISFGRPESWRLGTERVGVHAVAYDHDLLAWGSVEKLMLGL